ncbi:MAG: 30S ribosome-binding factor RbfA [Actinomycetota bacterium]
MANAQYPRAERVRHAIREVLAGELERMNDPGLGMVTITDVNVSPDLRNARVFYTVYGPEPTRASTRDALGRASGHLRTVVAREVRLRFAPRLELVEDPVPERVARIDSLIAKLNDPDHDPDPDHDEE